MPDDEDLTPREKLLTKLFKLTGGFSTFEFFAVFVYQCNFSSLSFWLYGMGFLTQYPDYTCTFKDPSQVTDPSEVCTAPSIS